MNSGFYPTRSARLNRPRAGRGDKSVQLGATVPASLKVTVQREADAEGVSLSHVVYAALIRQCGLSHDAREKGLLPIPGKLAEEEVLLCERAASSMGMTLDKWVAHKLLDAAAADVSRAGGAKACEREEAA